MKQGPKTEPCEKPRATLRSQDVALLVVTILSIT